MNLILQIFFSSWICKASSFKKDKSKIRSFTDIDMLLMLDKCIRGGICHSFYRYAKANNKYMKDYDKNKESLYLQHWDVSSLYSWAMSLNLLDDLMKIS